VRHAGGAGAAVALHHQELAAEAAGGQTFAQSRQVAVQHGLHGSVDRRCHAPLVFAILGQHGMTQCDVVVGPGLPRNLAGAALVRRVAVAVQEVDGQGFAARIQQLPQSPTHCVLVQRHQDLPVGVHALRDLQAQLPRYQRHEAAGEAVGRGPGATPQFQHVAEACRGDQANAREAALQQGVGGGGGTVDQGVDAVQGQPGAFQRRQHAACLVVRRGRNLGHADLTRGVIE
jgi:hypothetical protein